MNVPQEERLIRAGDVPAAGWQLLHKFGELVCRVETKEGDTESMLSAAVEAIGSTLSLDRCLVLLWGAEYSALEVSAEYVSQAARPLGARKYQLGRRSEFFKLLS